MEYIRRMYGVSAKRGGRVVADGKSGTITGTVSGTAWLRIRLDGEERTSVWHPTWRMEYVPVPSEPKR